MQSALHSCESQTTGLGEGALDGSVATLVGRIGQERPSTKAELLREARVHRIILASCGIDCDFKGNISL